MAELGRWMTGAAMVAGGAISLGYGGGIMWRAWVAQNGPLSDEQRLTMMFYAFMSIGLYAFLMLLLFHALERT